MDNLGENIWLLESITTLYAQQTTTPSTGEIEVKGGFKINAYTYTPVSEVHEGKLQNSAEEKVLHAGEESLQAYGVKPQMRSLWQCFSA